MFGRVSNGHQGRHIQGSSEIFVTSFGNSTSFGLCSGLDRLRIQSGVRNPLVGLHVLGQEKNLGQNPHGADLCDPRCRDCCSYRLVNCGSDRMMLNASFRSRSIRRVKCRMFTSISLPIKLPTDGTWSLLWLRPCSRLSSSDKAATRRESARN